MNRRSNSSISTARLSKEGYCSSRTREIGLSVFAASEKMLPSTSAFGKRVDVIPTTRGMNATEIYNKKGEYLGLLAFDERKRWQRFVLVDLDKDMQLSKATSST